MRSTVLAATLGLAGCSHERPPVTEGATPLSAESITMSVGPCFGFCPVYATTFASDGAIRFTGSRHTAVLGERRRHVDAAVYRSLAAELAPFRPAAGTEGRVYCDAAISDTSTYTVTWTGSDGRNAVTTLPSRCPGGPGQLLDSILRGLPARLGIADWAKQTTRPDAPRG